MAIKVKGNVKNLKGKNFRLVHDGVMVLAIIDGTAKNVTTTIHSVAEFNTKGQAVSEIENLGLEYENEGE